MAEIGRRTFFKRLAKVTAVVAGVASGVIDPEKLLWEPGKVTHFTPPVSGWQPRIIGVDLAYGESWSMEHPDMPDADFQRQIEAAAKALADRIDADAMKLYRLDPAMMVTPPGGGLSIRMLKNYDINSDRFPARLDVLYGMAAIRPELAINVVTGEVFGKAES